MGSLKGILYPSHHIEFPRELNPWAFQRMDAEMDKSKSNRVVMKPEVAPIELEPSSSIEPKDAMWLERTTNLLNTSDNVFLERKDQALRLRRAVHEINKHCQLITLAAQEDIDEFAAEFWSKVSFFYATRHDSFQFSLGTLISLKHGERERERTLELQTHQVANESGDPPQLIFNATGSSASVDIVEWRSSVPEGESGRFLLPDCQVAVLVTMAKQPMTFCHEYRDEYKNHAYIFEGEKLESRLARMLKRKRTPAD